MSESPTLGIARIARLLFLYRSGTDWVNAYHSTLNNLEHHRIVDIINQESRTIKDARALVGRISLPSSLSITATTITTAFAEILNTSVTHVDILSRWSQLIQHPEHCNIPIQQWQQSEQLGTSTSPAASSEYRQYAEISTKLDQMAFIINIWNADASATPTTPISALSKYDITCPSQRPTACLWQAKAPSWPDNLGPAPRPIIRRTHRRSTPETRDTHATSYTPVFDHSDGELPRPVYQRRPVIEPIVTAPSQPIATVHRPDAYNKASIDELADASLAIVTWIKLRRKEWVEITGDKPPAILDTEPVDKLIAAMYKLSSSLGADTAAALAFIIRTSTELIGSVDDAAIAWEQGLLAQQERDDLQKRLTRAEAKISELLTAPTASGSPYKESGKYKVAPISSINAKRRNR